MLVYIYIHKSVSFPFDIRAGTPASWRGLTGGLGLGVRVNPEPQRLQMLCVAAWVWFCLTTEFVGIHKSIYFLFLLRRCPKTWARVAPTNPNLFRSLCPRSPRIYVHIYIVRTQEKTCSSDSRFRRKLSGTTGHRLLGTQRPQILCVVAWVWFCLTTEFVDIYKSVSFPFLFPQVPPHLGACGFDEAVNYNLCIFI